MKKTTFRIVALLTLCLFLVNWGSVGHRNINKKTPESFPISMVGFGVWADSLSQHGSDADNRKSADPNESPRHYIDIDNYPEFKSTGRIASTYDSIVRIHGSGFVVSNGTLPWATRITYDSLKNAFKACQWHKAMLFASDLGHYVADGHMPLHITSNFDGGETGQSGIHSRYESNMVSSYLSSIINYKGEPAQYVSNVNVYVINYILTNQKYVQSVLDADTYASNLAGDNSSSKYYSSLWSKAGFTTTLFKNASHSLADLIYSAWVDAGSPVYGSKYVFNAMNSSSANNIKFYPNPTKGIITLVGDDVVKVNVATVTGTPVGSFTVNEVDLSKLSNGIYILSIYGKEGFLKKQKVLLSK
jgi:hypothetical protein